MVEAVAIEGDRIVAIGSLDEIRQIFTDQILTVDNVEKIVTAKTTSSKQVHQIKFEKITKIALFHGTCYL